MSKRVKTAILGVSIGLVLFTIVGGLGVRAASNDEDPYRELGVYTEVLTRIQSEYVEDPNIDKVTAGALHGLLESLDANSSYLTATEFQKYKERQDRGKASIGATTSKRFGYGAVVSVIPGGPADKAGLQSGDIIEAVEDKSTRDMSLAELQSTLQGEPGSQVSVSVVRPRKPQPDKIAITREVIKVPPVTDKMMSGNIGYVKVDALPKGKAAEIAGKVKSLQSSGANRLILDLRDCASGDEAEGIATANLFLDHGTITYLQGQKFTRETFNASPQKAISKLPLVVLVNRGTAGAAEIVAAAIKEDGRGKVVGEKTFGIGSVQKVIDIPDGSALILSIAKYYTPGGKAIQDDAVTPNVVVAGANEDFAGDIDEEAPDQPAQTPAAAPKPQNDQQLDKAIEVVKQQTA
jgi:carboxyl-terminal processing protease